MNICGYLNPVGGAQRCTNRFNDTNISGCQDKPGDSSFPYHIGNGISPELTDPVSFLVCTSVCLAHPSPCVAYLFTSTASTTNIAKQLSNRLPPLSLCLSVSLSLSPPPVAWNEMRK